MSECSMLRDRLWGPGITPISNAADQVQRSGCGAGGDWELLSLPVNSPFPKERHRRYI